MCKCTWAASSPPQCLLSELLIPPFSHCGTLFPDQHNGPWPAMHLDSMAATHIHHLTYNSPPLPAQLKFHTLTTACRGVQCNLHDAVRTSSSSTRYRTCYSGVISPWPGGRTARWWSHHWQDGRDILRKENRKGSTETDSSYGRGLQKRYQNDGTWGKIR